MNDEAVYRTAPATPGLLIISVLAIQQITTAWNPTLNICPLAQIYLGPVFCTGKNDLHRAGTDVQEA